MKVSPQSLTSSLSGHWAGGYGTAPCPVCQPEKRHDQNALTIGEGGGRLLLHCKRAGCAFSDILKAAGISPGHFELDLKSLERAKAERLEAETKAKRKARSIWERGDGIEGTKGEDYLRGRGIKCPLPDTLRWLPDIYHGPSGRWHSAMVANVVAASGEPMGIHRTFFTKQGVRLQASAKMMLGRCAGGAVHLSDGAGPLVVCEGIETGLSLASGLLSGPASVLAALSTSGMTGLELPKEPDKLIVAPDDDDAGRAASDKLATRATALGWKVSILEAPKGRDWNDVIRGNADAA